MRDWNELLRDRLKPEEPSKQQISDLLAAARRDSQDAAVTALTLDGRFKHAYDSGRILCDIVVQSEGWRSVGPGHHETVISSLPHLLGPEATPLAEHLDQARQTRANLVYSGRVGIVSAAELQDLVDTVAKLESTVLAWLKEKHPDLRPDD